MVSTHTQVIAMHHTPMRLLCRRLHACSLIHKTVEFTPQFLQCVFKADEFTEQMFMVGISLFGDIVALGMNRSFVVLDFLFEIVDVDQLDVQLVLEVFYLLQLLFGERGTAGLLKHFLKLVKFFSVVAKDLPPISAFSGKL